MRKGGFIFILSLCFCFIFAGQAIAQNYVTVGGHFASPSKDLLEQVHRMAIQKDTEAIARLVLAGSVIMLKPDLPIYLEESTWGGLVKIRFKGSTLSVWTVNEAIKKVR